MLPYSWDEVPESYETFWSHFDIPGLQFGQKGGYLVFRGTPYHLVGSGFLPPLDGSSQGFAATMVLTTGNSDLWDPQRRLVFPLGLDFVREALGELAPGR